MKNLKTLRESNKISQQKLAEQFGITQQSIYKYENGLTEPDIQSLIRIADYFGTSVDYLIGNTTRTEQYPVSSNSDINKDEQELIDSYRRLSPEAKELFLKLIKVYGEN